MVIVGTRFNQARIWFQQLTKGRLLYSHLDTAKRRKGFVLTHVTVVMVEHNSLKLKPINYPTIGKPICGKVADATKSESETSELGRALSLRKFLPP